MVTLAKIIEECNNGNLGARDAIELAYDAGIKVGQDRTAIYTKDEELEKKNFLINQENYNLRKAIGYLGKVVGEI